MVVNYELWTMLGTWFSGFAMVSSVIVSLYLSTRLNKVKIKVEFFPTLINASITGECCISPGISVINIGERNVILTDYGIYLNRKFSISFIPSETNIVLPYELKPESSVNIQLSNEALIQIYNEGLIPNNSKVSVYVKTLAGNRYKIKIKVPFNELVKHAYDYSVWSSRKY